jgi:hypothetical protein
VKRQLLWRLARRYWFDALVLAALGVGLAWMTVRLHRKDGPLGPLWFDVLAILAITVPVFARRRFPFGAPVAVGVAMASSSFVDGRAVIGLIPVLVAIAVFILIGTLRDRMQAVAGLAFGIGVTAIVAHNDPNGWQAGNFGWFSTIFTIAWTIAFTLGRKFQEADEA